MSVHRWVLLLAALVLAGTAAMAIAADRTATLDDATRTFAWQGPKTTATSLPYLIDAGEPCVQTEVVFCDSTLLHVDFEPVISDRLVITVPATGTNDFDLHVYESDADGGPGLLVASSAHDAPSTEAVTIPRPSGWFLVKVVYYDVVDGAYSATAELKSLPAEGTPTPTPTPTATATATSTATPVPAAAAPPAATPAGVPPPASPAAPATQLRIVRRTARRVVVRLTCAEACRAVVEARWRSRRRRARTVLGAGDTHELWLRAPRSARVRALVRPRTGGRATVLRPAP
jgi:hypothetical protein